MIFDFSDSSLCYYLFHHLFLQPTPTYSALEMALDAIYSNYSQEVILLDKHKVPSINFISQVAYPKAKLWLEKNAPHSDIKVMGKHLMFWEHPDQFNHLLDEFLDKSFI